MKKFLFPLALAGMIGMTSCSEDFEVAAPYKQVTVVYAMLNPKDTAHYVRVQKVFVDEKKSAIDMAKVSDSSFYKEGEIDVILEEIRNNGQVNAYPLTRVNLAAEGYPKYAASGDQNFFTTPHYGYKTKQTLNSAYKYNVKVVNKVSGETVETVPTTAGSKGIGIVNTNDQNVIGGFYISKFHEDARDHFIDLERTSASSFYRLLGNVPANGTIIEGILRFRWVDKNTISGAQVDRSVDYHFDDTTGNNGRFLLTTSNTSIYSFLADAIGPAPANTERYMDSCDIIVWAGSEELYRYQQINLAQGSGITGDQIKPNYTNLTGSKSVLGLVASRTYVMARNVPLGREAPSGGSGNYSANYSIDSLRTNPITANLNIKGRSDH
jgi:hypothetical protein